MPESDPIDPGRAPIEQSGEPTVEEVVEDVEHLFEDLRDTDLGPRQIAARLSDHPLVKEVKVPGGPFEHVFDVKLVEPYHKLAPRVNLPLDDPEDSPPAPGRPIDKSGKPVTPVAPLLVSEVVAFLAGLTLGLLIGWVVL